MTKSDTLIVVVKNPTESDSAALVHEAIERLKTNHIDFNTFSAKIKVQYRDNKLRNYEFNTFIRIQKDQTIWLSINASLGFEAFRVLITPDSVKLIDKLAKTVKYHSVEYMKGIAQLPIDFYTLQDLVIGNPVYLDSTHITTYRERESSVSLATIGGFFKHLLSLRKTDYTLLHSKLDDIDPTRSRTADFTYNDYEYIEGRLFSTKRLITVAEKIKLDLSLDYKQVEFDKPLTFPFNIPRNYNIE